jgi:hypothetical protein
MPGKRQAISGDWNGMKLSGTKAACCPSQIRQCRQNAHFPS